MNSLLNKHKFGLNINDISSNAFRKIDFQLRAVNSLETNLSVIRLNHFESFFAKVSSDMKIFKDLGNRTSSVDRMFTHDIFKEVNSGMDVLRSLVKSAEKFQLPTFEDPFKYSDILSKQHIAMDLKLKNLMRPASIEAFERIQAVTKIDIFNKINENSKAIHLFNSSVAKWALKNAQEINLDTYNEYFSDTDIEDFVYDLEGEIQNQLAENKDFTLLSTKAKSKVISFFLRFIFEFAMAVMANVAASYILDIIRNMDNVSTPIEAKREAKKYAITPSHIDLSAYRYTYATKLRLRSVPSMSSETMAFLPSGKVLKVLDKSNRSWLLVETELGDETIRGWVSRRYTKKFQR